MSVTKTIDISVLPEAEQDLIKALFDKCCKRANQKEEKKSEPKIWKPKCGEWYWFISTDGQINNCEWINDRIDRGRYSMGDCFRTKEEATFAREKQKIKIELQRFADEHNDPKKLELDGENHHYRIGYDIDDNELVITRSLNVRQDGIYFSSKEIAADAANKIGVKRILKYLFDVDCEVDE
jgi:hypothetical protein